MKGISGIIPLFGKSPGCIAQVSTGEHIMDVLTRNSEI